MEAVNLVILFSDIHDFSRIQAGMDLEEQAGFVQEIYETLGGCIVSAGGTIVKYMGDAILSFFPDGAAVPTVACARAMRAADIFGEPVNQAAMLGHYRGVAITEEVASAVSGSYAIEQLPDFHPKWMSKSLKVWRIRG